MTPGISGEIARRSTRCVLVFARPPREEAWQKKVRGGEPFFAHLLRRAVSRAAAVPGVDLLVTGNARIRLPKGARRLRQSEGSFGQRLIRALGDARNAGYAHIIVIGADTPGLTTSDLEAAFEKLSRHDLVLGPARDGGVYLIGLRGDAARQLEGVSWCTPQVFGQLVHSRPNVAVLGEIRADVDGVEDLAMLLAGGGLDRALIRCAAALVSGDVRLDRARGQARRIPQDLIATIDAPRPPPAITTELDTPRPTRSAVSQAQ